MGQLVTNTTTMESFQIAFLFGVALMVGFHLTEATFCYWDGTPPNCLGACPVGFNESRRDAVGDGGTCWSGTKAKCCITSVNSTCHWEGTAPFCTSGCPEGHREIIRDVSGDGRNCWSGLKSLCCK